ncbi:MAG TPA: pyridoxamine 5'-phosphate oxidase family protein [Saccharofermentans sp.]|nr:pyridoxamine 5'-phosphate oxidase family protein [Saccharofermentans sp.]
MDNTIDALLKERFGQDSLISLATLDGNKPAVRTIDAIYYDGAFYGVTYTLSNKMKQIAINSDVAICGMWFTANAFASNLGHVLKPENTSLITILRDAFSKWYSEGDVNEDDVNTCIIKIVPTSGVFVKDGTRYEF